MNRWNIGDWCWHARQGSPCRVIDRQDVWGEVFFRVWLADVNGAKTTPGRFIAATLTRMEEI